MEFLILLCCYQSQVAQTLVETDQNKFSGGGDLRDGRISGNRRILTRSQLGLSCSFIEFGLDILWMFLYF